MIREQFIRNMYGGINLLKELKFMKQKLTEAEKHRQMYNN